MSVDNVRVLRIEDEDKSNVDQPQRRWNTKRVVQ